MDFRSVCISGLLVATIMLTGCADRVDWHRLSNNGKGVMIAKIRSDSGGIAYVCCRGRNAELKTSELLRSGIVVSDWNALRRSVKAKPTECALFLCNDKDVEDDLGILLPFTEAEAQALTDGS